MANLFSRWHLMFTFSDKRSFMVEETLSLVQINSNNLKLLCLFDHYLLDLKYPFEFLLLSILTKSTEFNNANRLFSKFQVKTRRFFSAAKKKKRIVGYVTLYLISCSWFSKVSRYFFNFIVSLVLCIYA